MNTIAKPKKIYKNFQDFFEKCLHGVLRCPYCLGWKKVVAPGEQLDPVEGYKLANRIPCPTCKGTGRVPLKVAKEEYQLWLSSYKEEKKKWLAQQIMINHIKSKLNKRQIEFLGL